MNTQEKIEVMQAWLEGKTIGWQWSDKTWTKPDEPYFYPDNTYHVIEPTKKLASEWFNELPGSIQWALPEHEDKEQESLEDAVYGLPNWAETEQGKDFWNRVAIADYPTRAETVLATWEGVKVSNKTVPNNSSYFIPQTAKGRLVWGIDQNGYECCWGFDHLADWGLYKESTNKLASEWFKELPEHIKWALPEYVDGERRSLWEAVHGLPRWEETEQGISFWSRVAKADYPTRAETVLATWEGVKVRLKYWSKGRYFIPQTVGDGGVWGVDQDGIACYLAFDNLEDWELYTEPERELIDPVRLLGKILWNEKGEAIKVITERIDIRSWGRKSYQWSDTVDSEKHSMYVGGGRQ